MLRAVVVMDYQNVHLTGAGLFSPYAPLHESLIHPLSYATRLISTRNAKQRDERFLAELCKVQVFRGLPSPAHDPDPYAWNQANKSSWERDSRVSVVHRPLKYIYERTADGTPASDDRGNRIVKGKQEKGIDVLCALAVVRESQLPDCDVVILASQDTDLEPALDEASRIGAAKIETAAWFDPDHLRTSKELRPSKRVWNTRLGYSEFQKSIDTAHYGR